MFLKEQKFLILIKSQFVSCLLPWLLTYLVSFTGRGFDNLTSVHLARHTPTGTLVTIKITNLENCTEERLKALQKGLILSHFFRHPNITTYWTVFTVGSWLWVISPFMAYGSARHLLKTYFPEGMSETLIRSILFGAVRGLNYLHQNGCIHRICTDIM